MAHSQKNIEDQGSKLRGWLGLLFGLGFQGWLEVGNGAPSFIVLW